MSKKIVACLTLILVMGCSVASAAYFCKEHNMWHDGSRTYYCKKHNTWHKADGSYYCREHNVWHQGFGCCHR